MMASQEMRAEIKMNHEKTLHHEEERLQLLDTMQELVCIFQMSGNFVYANRLWLQELGYAIEDLRGNAFPLVLDRQELSKWKKIKQRLKSESFAYVTFTFRTKKNESLYVCGSLTLISGADGMPQVMGVFHNAAVFLSERRDWERFFSLAGDLLCVFDMKGRFCRVNPAFESVLGYTEEDLIGRPLMGYIHSDDWISTKKKYSQILKGQLQTTFENRFRCMDGTYKWLSLTAYAFLSEGVFYVVAQDITEERNAKERLKQMAFTDDLTSLLNRRGFYFFANKLVQLAVREKKYFLLMLADLDALKAINDQYGHSEGDAALVRSAWILKGRFRVSDIVGRIGGDEFAAALILDELPDLQKLGQELDRLVQESRLLDAFPYEPPTFSIGFSYAHIGHRLTLEDMFEEADRMMYQEKSTKQRLRTA